MANKESRIGKTRRNLAHAAIQRLEWIEMSCEDHSPCYTAFYAISPTEEIIPSVDIFEEKVTLSSGKLPGIKKGRY